MLAVRNEVINAPFTERDHEFKVTRRGDLLTGADVDHTMRIGTHFKRTVVREVLACFVGGQLDPLENVPTL